MQKISLRALIPLKNPEGGLASTRIGQDENSRFSKQSGCKFLLIGFRSSYRSCFHS